MRQEYGFIFNDKQVDPSAYGGNYIPELTRILDQFAPASSAKVLEWGSGLTTQVFADYAQTIWHSDLVLSLDEYSDYQKSIFADRPIPDCLKMVTLNLIGPGQSQKDQGLNFSTYPLSLGHKFDIIFIDARRRMECAFIAALLCHKDTVIIIHDYRRARYQPIVALFEIIEDGPQYRVLRPRTEILEALKPGAFAVEMYFKCLKFNEMD